MEANYCQYSIAGRKVPPDDPLQKGNPPESPILILSSIQLSDLHENVHRGNNVAFGQEDVKGTDNFRVKFI